MRNMSPIETEGAWLSEADCYLETVARVLKRFNLIDASRLVDGAIYGVRERLKDLDQQG